jgi:Clp amino terminal domain, pathogenicity island component
MFERFTDRARRVVVLAQEEARLLNHNYIGTEHLLLGLLSEREGVACEALESFGLSLETVRHDVEEIVGIGQDAFTGRIPFTPRAKSTLENSLREALQLRHNYIGTEHILLGLIREGEGVAVQVLLQHDVDLEEARERVLELLARRPGGEEPVERIATVRTAGRAPFAVGTAYPHQPSAPPPELLRVVPIARQVDTGDEVRLILLSLEIWSGWLDLRLAAVGPMVEQLARPPLAYGSWSLSDDRGTAYSRVGSSVSGNNVMNVWQVSFSPSPPAEVRTLTLTLSRADATAGEEIRVVVELAA